MPARLRSLALFVALAAACSSPSAPDKPSEAHISARPHAPSNRSTAGEYRLGPQSGRGALLYIPRTITPGAAVPVMVMLHGAGGGGEQMRFTFADAERTGTVILAPDSREQTWDVIMGGFGPDVQFITSMLEETFDRVEADPARVSVGGFSDGASYALTIGLSNGELFTRIIAFSPGFNAAPRREGKPRIFISHGTRDEVLPIDRTSRHLVPALRNEGYDVTYREFDGPHTVPPDIIRDAFDWAR
jgi:phospholipase/carboxylesterase